MLSIDIILMTLDDLELL